MSLWKKTRLRIEAIFCRAGFWVFPRLPSSWLRALAHIAGVCAFRLAAPQRRVALANLDLALGNSRSALEKRRIARASFQSFARTSLETLAGSRLSTENMERYFEFAPGALDLLKELLARRKGLIGLTFHFGNWEWLSLAWAMAGFPSTIVAQPIKNPWIETMFRSIRESRFGRGHRLVHRRHAAPRLYRALKRGEIIGLLVDLHSSLEEGGAFFDFFGVPALTTRAAGFLAVRTGAPVVCSVARPQADGRYRIEIGPEIFCDPDTPPEKKADAITRRWLSHCERLIHQEPELWMWMYKRWKARPTAEMGRYPFYSFYEPKSSLALAPR